MQAPTRVVSERAEVLALAETLDARAAQFMAQFSDRPYPAGAVRRLLQSHFGDPALVLVVAESAPRGPLVGVCLVGPARDPLLGTTQPMILVLHVETAWRHRGIARELLERSAAELEERGLTSLAARVGHNDDALISMGERWGFVRTFEVMVRE
jgi:GNAT superfamily N-acetyltransferase